MGNFYLATINELRWNKEEKEAKQKFARKNFNNVSNSKHKYRVGDNVTFRFGGCVKKGRITTLVSYTDEVSYNIETPTRQWYLKILQKDVVCKSLT